MKLINFYVQLRLVLFYFLVLKINNKVTVSLKESGGVNNIHLLRLIFRLYSI